MFRWWTGFILSYLIVLLKWGVSRLTEGATKERRKRRHQLGKKLGGGREGTWEINTSRHQDKNTLALTRLIFYYRQCQTFCVFSFSMSSLLTWLLKFPCDEKHVYSTLYANWSFLSLPSDIIAAAPPTGRRGFLQAGHFQIPSWCKDKSNLHRPASSVQNHSTLLWRKNWVGIKIKYYYYCYYYYYYYS